MMDEASKRAVEIGKLRRVQQKLAISGHHQEARHIGDRLRPLHKQAALDYLGVKELPTNANGALVEELAVMVAAVSTKTETAELRGVLRRAAWSKKAETTGKLVRAQSMLPDLKKTLEALR